MGGIIYYGRYTKDQVEQANQIDLEELLRRNGATKASRSGAISGLTTPPGKAGTRSVLCAGTMG